jgi:hypothetical protein
MAQVKREASHGSSGSQRNPQGITDATFESVNATGATMRIHLLNGDRLGTLTA